MKFKPNEWLRRIRIALLPKITLLVVLFSLLTYGVYAGFDIHFDKEEGEESLRKLGSTIATNLAYNAEYPVLIGNEEMLVNLLKGAFKQKWVTFAAVQDSEGNLLASIGEVGNRKAPSAHQLRDKPAVWFTRPNDRRLETWVLIRRSRGLAVPDLLTEPARSETSGEIVGTTRVGMSTTELLANLRLNRWRASLLSLAVGTIGSALLVLILKRTVTSPLDVLLEGTRKIQAGELSHRVGVRSTDEIGELAASFNSMAEALQKHTENLSQLVEEKTQDIEKVNKELKDFVYIVSHDLKEPLRGIESFSAFLVEDYGDRLEGEAREYLAGIHDGAIRMKMLIEDLLLLSRVTRIRNPYRRVSSEQIVREAMESLRFPIEEKNVQIVLQPDMPWIVCDEIKMREVFKNLLSNAMKFSRELPPRIEMSWCEEDGAYRFSVKDNGIGIEEKYVEKIFEVFYRLHRREEYEGTGLGLHLVRKIIEEHGGRIWVLSTPGVGSTFLFTVPKRQVAPEEEQTAPPEYCEIPVTDEQGSGTFPIGMEGGNEG